MYNYKLTTSFVSPEVLNARTIKTGFNIMIVHFYIRRKMYIIRYDTRFFGSNPAVINQFLIYTGKLFPMVDKNKIIFKKLRCLRKGVL